MECYQCQGIEMQFDRKAAAAELRRVRTRGPAPTTRALVDALKTEDLEGTSLLDIGGGVGVIQFELLESGVVSATGVEASSAFIGAAKEEAVRRGYSGRVEYRHGDFVHLAPEIAPADIVTLDRVVCCYPDMAALVALSAARARRLYGVVYPRDTWWNRAALAILNFARRLRRSPFRVFVHSTRAVDALIRRHGLEQNYYRQTLVWQVVVYARPLWRASGPPPQE